MLEVLYVVISTQQWPDLPLSVLRGSVAVLPQAEAALLLLAWLPHPGTGAGKVVAGQERLG